MLFSGHTIKMFLLVIGFGCMHGTVFVLGRRIYRVQTQRLVPGVHDVMLCPSGDHDCPVDRKAVLDAMEGNKCLPCFNADESVVMDKNRDTSKRPCLSCIDQSNGFGCGVFSEDGGRIGIWKAG